MKRISTLFAVLALLGGACLTGCVAQVGQEETATSQSTLGTGAETEPGANVDDQVRAATPSNPGDPTSTQNGDPEGPHPWPWKTMAAQVQPQPVGVEAETILQVNNTR